MGENEYQRDEQHRDDTGKAQGSENGHTGTALLSGECGNGSHHPRDEHDTEYRHDPECVTPAYDLGEKGTGRDADCQRHRRPDHRHGHGLPTLVRGHHPSGVPGQS